MKPSADAGNHGARYSLRWRLPALVCGVIAAVLATFLWAAYARVQSTLMRAAGERAQAAADQFARLLDGQRGLEQLAQLGADPALQKFLELRSEDTQQAARTRLNALAGGGLRRIELWDAGGARLIEIPARPGSAASRKALPPGDPPFTAGIHGLRGSDDVVFTDSVAEIRGRNGLLGHLLIRSTFSENPPGIFSRLIGGESVVRIGNRRGDVWTDFARVVPSLPVDLERPGVASYRTAGGEWRVGAASHVRATPLAVWVDFPLAAAVAPAGAFLRQMIPVAVVFLAASAVVVSFLSARITRPLADLTAAAEALAAGDYSRRVSDRRRDEVGRLGRTFNAMADQVREAHDRLEARVEERTARLKAANRELEAFSYSVSHDLRAPLRGIDGFSQALLEDAAGKLSDEEQDYLHRVRRAAQRMAQLIDDLLEFGRVGRAEPNRQRADLTAIAGAVVAELKRREPQREVQVDIQQGLEAQVDPALLQIVLENLIGNAWKFTANAHPARIQFGAEPRAGEVVHFVRDNGAGFDMAYAGKLFQPFQRLHRDAEFAGTGIGLATVHRIIERHGGRVWAEGAVGAGATVHFVIPDASSGP